VFDFEAVVKATGRTVELVELHLWTFGADGKVRRFAHHVDRHAMVLAHEGAATG
jgi:hypothetical protein